MELVSLEMGPSPPEHFLEIPMARSGREFTEQGKGMIKHEKLIR